MASDIEIESVTFAPQGIVITFFEPDNVRVDGAVVVTRQISLSKKHPDYAEDMDRLHDKVVRVLRNALEDWSESPAWRPEEEDDDDERGMGEK